MEQLKDSSVKDRMKHHMVYFGSLVTPLSRESLFTRGTIDTAVLGSIWGFIFRGTHCYFC
ncbi:hypothetical protein LINPERPRIM_LOCUS19745, partial [Linum perenne]